MRSWIFEPQTSSPVRWQWVSLTGPDARDFLQRLSSADAKHLPVGSGSGGCFLTPTGKVLSVFTLWHYGEQEFAFEFDGGSDGHWRDNLLQTIDRYTFAERMTLTPVESLESRWIFCEPADEAKLLAAIGTPDLQADRTVAIDEEIRINHRGTRDFGLVWLSVWARPARLQQWLEKALPETTSSPADWRMLERRRVDSVRPWTGLEIDENTMPLEAGLYEAVAQQKGCYPGQEVIERVLSQGAPAKRLARIEGNLQGSAGAPEKGQEILNLAEPPAEIGRVTSVIIEGDRFFALGYLRKIHAKEGLAVRLPSGSTGTVTRISTDGGTDLGNADSNQLSRQ